MHCGLRMDRHPAAWHRLVHDCVLGFKRRVQRVRVFTAARHCEAARNMGAETACFDDGTTRQIARRSVRQCLQGLMSPNRLTWTNDVHANCSRWHAALDHQACVSP